jgi:hypothetical protein
MNFNMRIKTLTVGLLALGWPAAPALAAVPMAFVSGSGGGTTCSFAAPCASFQAAHDAVDDDGHIVCLDTTVWAGTLTVTKKVDIDCRNAFGKIIAPPGGSAVIVNTPGVEVTLRGLDLGAGNGQAGTGVTFLNGNGLNLFACVIHGFRAGGGGNGVGVFFAPSSGTALLQMFETIVFRSGLPASGGGVIIQPSGSASARAVIDHALIKRNTYGVFANGTGTTGQISLQLINSVVDNSIVNGVSSFTSGAAATIVMDQTTSMQNGSVGVLAQGSGAFVLLSRSVITSNVTGLSTVGGGVIISYGDNRLANATDGAPTFVKGLQ